MGEEDGDGSGVEAIEEEAGHGAVFPERPRSGTPPSGLPAISPARGEIGSSHARPTFAALEIGESG
ncbi:hypothetical protein MesoLj131b_30370 [Mesorhizobium sp. 131-2-5]|nr:hypothetical protein MesoLj131b_30370 [Mesorhizobium sp. 131-2-5]